MPSATVPDSVNDPSSLPKWKRPEQTKRDIPWANIKVLDLSKYDQPGGKGQLAAELRDAVDDTGFFSLSSTGFTEAEVQRQYDIGQGYFGLPKEDKGRPECRCDFAQGKYFGYRAPHEKTIMGTQVLDNVESVNIAKFIPQYANEPFHPFFHPFKAEFENFSRKAASIADKIFTLFSIILELPEDYFSTRHAYESTSEDHLRYMTYHPRPLSEDALVQNMWSRAHTDFGSLTLLWSQDIAGLQITTSSDEWRYVPAVDSSSSQGTDVGIVCNVGDTLDFWSAGYFKSTTHRVVRPPEDQAHLFRQGLFYFVRPGENVDIKPAPPPLLRRLGKVSSEDVTEAVTGLQYVRERVKSYHNHKDYADMKGKKFTVGNLEIEDEAT